MTITGSFVDPFYTGTTSVNQEVPGKYMVSLAGRGFMVDTNSNLFRHQSIPLLRSQADQSLQPGEQSVNPEDLWRRRQSTWHAGSGQEEYDADEDSDGRRFYRSKGVDPWTRNELRLLPATTEIHSTSNTNLKMAVAGARLYLLDGTSIKYTEDLSTISDVTGESGTAGTHITSDGKQVYVACGSDGIYVSDTGSTAFAKGVTGTVAGCRYVKGRLFAWAANSLYNVVAYDTDTPESLPTALLEHPNDSFAWVDVCEGPGFYYAAGVAGDKSLIYRTSVKSDGSGLEGLVEAAVLPDGEVIRSVYGYLGFVLIGTDKGIRFGQPDASGNIVLGALIEDATAVRCFEGQDRFVWFGWTGFDSASTGLGRMDLSVFNGTRPAYASDLMTSGSGAILDVVTFAGQRVFTVSGDGVYTEDTDLVGSGFVESGQISYGLYEQKVTTKVTVTHDAIAGSLKLEASKDGAGFEELSALQPLAGSTRTDFSTNRARGERFNYRLTLERDGTDATTGPVVRRVTLKAYPSVSRSFRITLPLLLHSKLRLNNGATESRNVVGDFEFLTDLEANGDTVTYQEGEMSWPVVVEDHIWLPHHGETDRSGFAGTYVAQLKKFAED